MDTLKLARPLANAILSQAQKSPDTEICGLLGGKNGQALSAYPVENAAQQPQRRYQMSPHQQIETMRTMRDAGEELIAIYHSHPSSPAQPSAIDIAEASYPEAAYLIVSLNIIGVLEMTAFHINNGNIEELGLELE